MYKEEHTECLDKKQYIRVLSGLALGYVVEVSDFSQEGTPKSFLQYACGNNKS